MIDIRRRAERGVRLCSVAFFERVDLVDPTAADDADGWLHVPALKQRIERQGKPRPQVRLTESRSSTPSHSPRAREPSRPARERESPGRTCGRRIPPRRQDGEHRKP